MPRIPRTIPSLGYFFCLLAIAGIIAFGFGVFLHGLDELLFSLVLP